jgi:hypothetical protein
MEIKLIDNFLEKNVFNNIKEILTNDKFCWYYQSTVGNKNDYTDFFFCHFLFENDQQVSPSFSNILMPILGKLNFNYLIRAKINLYTKKDKIIKTAFHKDFNEKHTVALYSVNTNNGYTLFKNNQKIYSKENQLIIFNGSLEHCSVAQTDEKIRINININIK